MYFVEYDKNNQPYKIYCDENGNPVDELITDFRAEENSYSKDNKLDTFSDGKNAKFIEETQEKKVKTNKSKKWILALVLVVSLLVLSAGDTLFIKNILQSQQLI